MSRIRRRKGTEGTVAIEFALLLPVLLAILLGIMDYGWVYFVRLNMTNAAREGARVGVTKDTAIEVVSAAEATAGQYMQNAGFTPDGVKLTVKATGPAADGRVTVEVTIPNFKNDFALVRFVPLPDSMQVEAAMRWELAGLGP